MGADESRERSRVADQSTPRLPRYIIDHIGQVLRNRSREGLLDPVPRAMLETLEAAHRAGGSTRLRRKPDS